jgi:hypothetical protein
MARWGASFSGAPALAQPSRSARASSRLAAGELGRASGARDWCRGCEKRRRNVQIATRAGVGRLGKLLTLTLRGRHRRAELCGINCGIRLHIAQLDR